MRKQVTVTGKGFSEQQAKVSAYNELKASYKGNVLVYGMISCIKAKEAKAAQQCTTTNFPVAPGTSRKWNTMHNLYTENVTTGKLEMIPMTGDDAVATTGKTEAIKKAKELSIKHQIAIEIRVEKELDITDGSTNVEAKIEPKAAIPGEWTIVLDIETIA